MFRAALLILSGNAAASLLLLARNLIVARLIPVADYGVAATFAIAMAVVEMASALGLQQQIVQAKNGDDLRFQAALQGFQVLRGIILGALLFACAGPIADFLNVPQAAWAYRVMALVPVLNAFTHFDIYRMNRTMVFWPVILTGAVPALLSVLAVWPLASWYGDYRVMLYAIIVQALTTAIVSHLVSQRPYLLVLDRRIMSSSLRFGWPLLVNGVLLFAVFNGDKLIVGRELGMEALAIFAMGFTLTLTPTLVIAKSAQNFFLPQLSQTDRSTAKGGALFTHLSMTTFEVHIAFGLCLVLGTILIGDPMIRALLGEKYLSLIPLMTWLSIMQAIRVFKGGPSCVALAEGKSENAMIANLVRFGSLPLAWWIVVQGGGELDVIWIAIAGETIGFGIAVALAMWRVSLSTKPLILPMALSFLVLALAGIQTMLISTNQVGPAYIVTGIAFIALIMTVFTMSDLKRYVTRR